MSNALYNLAAMTVASTGTGTITLNAAATVLGVKYLTFALAGVPDGALVFYSINDVGQSELGGPSVYTASGTTLARNPINSTNGNAAINMTAAAIVRITPATSQLREVLTAARTYYVRTDGNDSNTGLYNTAAGAFLTVQKAIDTLCSIDMGIYQATIQIADGTYAAAVVLKRWLGALPPIIRGNNATPANVVLSVAAGHVIANDNGPKWRILDLKVATTGGVGDCLNASNGGNISFGNLNFGATSGYHIEVQNGGSISGESNYAVSGGASGHYAAAGGQILVNGLTVTLSGSLTFNNFAIANRSGGNLDAYSMTFTGGTITGVRYSASINGTIVSLGGANYFPGNSAGSTASGGQYV